MKETSHRATGKKKNEAANTAGVIVLQWLTYAFWGWTLLAINWLIFIVILFLLAHQNHSSAIPYAIASSLVLLPISVVCDYFYGKREPSKKSGAAVIVMVVHAVIFALLGIGALIAAVFNIVQMVISTSSDGASTTAWTISFVVSALLFGFMFLRTLNLSPKLKIQRVYPLTMIILVVGFMIVAFVGPVHRSSLTKNDRNISDNLQSVADAVNEYAMNNNKLPSSLSNVSLGDAAAVIVNSNLVTYKQEAPTSISKASDYANGDTAGNTYFHYELCVSYKFEDESANSYDGTVSGSRYDTFVNTSNHPAGNVCYKVETKAQTS